MSEAGDRRTRILDAAARLFSENGFEQTSVRQIADKVNILAGSLYHHFRTKDEILHEILRSPQENLIRQNNVILNLPIDPERRLIATIIARFHQSSSMWHVNTLLNHEAKFFRQREDFAYIQEAKNRSSLAMQNLLRSGMEANLFRGNMDTYLTVGTIWEITTAAISRLRADQFFTRTKAYTLDDIVDYDLHCVLRIVRTAARIDAPVPREEVQDMVMPLIANS